MKFLGNGTPENFLKKIQYFLLSQTKITIEIFLICMKCLEAFKSDKTKKNNESAEFSWQSICYFLTKQERFQNFLQHRKQKIKHIDNSFNRLAQIRTRYPAFSIKKYSALPLSMT